LWLKQKILYSIHLYTSIGIFASDLMCFLGSTPALAASLVEQLRQVLGAYGSKGLGPSHFDMSST
jgi:hypothetical protein